MFQEVENEGEPAPGKDMEMGIQPGIDALWVLQIVAAGIAQICFIWLIFRYILHQV